MSVTQQQETTQPWSAQPRTRSPLWLGVLMVGFGAIDWLFSSDPQGTLLTRLIAPTAYVIVMVAILLLRNRAPREVFLACLLLTVAMQVAFSPAQPIVLLYLALYTVATWTTPREALGVLALMLVPVLGAAYNVWTINESFLIADLLAVPSVYGGLGLLAWWLGRRDRIVDLHNAQLQEQVRLTALHAAEAERQRIARELHDILAHSVSAMMMQAAGARAVTTRALDENPAEARMQQVQTSLGTIESIGSQSMRELHRLLGVLRASESDDTTGDHDAQHPDVAPMPGAQPGLGDLDALVQTPRESGLIVQIHRSGRPGRVDPSVGTAAYRVVQEALTNAMKHAGQGAVVDVHKAWHPETVEVQIRCRPSSTGGLRPQTPGSGTGLRGLHERVALIGGELTSGWSGGEFVTTAVLPAHATDDDRP